MNVGRFGTGLIYNYASTKKVKFVLNERELKAWRKRNIFVFKKNLLPERVFVEDMSDLFGIWVSDETLDRIFATMEMCPSLIFQVLTKQSGRMVRYLTDRWGEHPPRNIWVGVSVENQKWYEERRHHLYHTPAAVRFFSFEPLLGEIVLAETKSFHWAIIGGESGKNRRPCEIAWIENIAAQCKQARIATFVKQDSALRPGQKGRIPDDIWALKEFPQ
jgi:protein gp37